jgi:hypothetical protein
MQNRVSTGGTSDLAAAPITSDSIRYERESYAIASGNVLADVRRDMSGKQPYVVCPSDLATGQMPAGCPRWSEIAGAL